MLKTCVSADVYSVASVKKPENTDEILENHDKFLDSKGTSKEVTQLEVHELNSENHVGNLKKIRDEIGEGKKHENKAIKDELNDCDGLKLTKIAKNLEDEVGHDDTNAHKPRIIMKVTSSTIPRLQ